MNVVKTYLFNIRVNTSFGNLPPLPYLTKEGHSEVRAQQSFTAMHHLHHFSICTVECVIQVCQFLFHKCKKKIAEIINNKNQQGLFSTSTSN